MNHPGDDFPMQRRGATTKVFVDLPPEVASKLAEEVARGRYASMEEAVLVGARLVAGLGPRALELLAEGRGADQLVRPTRDAPDGRWR